MSPFSSDRNLRWADPEGSSQVPWVGGQIAWAKIYNPEKEGRNHPRFLPKIDRNSFQTRTPPKKKRLGPNLLLIFLLENGAPCLSVCCMQILQAASSLFVLRPGRNGRSVLRLRQIAWLSEVWCLSCWAKVRIFTAYSKNWHTSRLFLNEKTEHPRIW